MELMVSIGNELGLVATGLVIYDDLAVPDDAARGTPVADILYLKKMCPCADPAPS